MIYPVPATESGEDVIGSFVKLAQMFLLSADHHSALSLPSLTTSPKSRIETRKEANKISE